MEETGFERVLGLNEGRDPADDFNRHYRRNAEGSLVPTLRERAERIKGVAGRVGHCALELLKLAAEVRRQPGMLSTAVGNEGYRPKHSAREVYQGLAYSETALEPDYSNAGEVPTGASE